MMVWTQKFVKGGVDRFKYNSNPLCPLMGGPLGGAACEEGRSNPLRR